MSEQLTEEQLTNRANELRAKREAEGWVIVTDISQVTSGRDFCYPRGYTMVINPHSLKWELYDTIRKAPGDGIPLLKVQMSHFNYKDVEWLQEQIDKKLVMRHI